MQALFGPRMLAVVFRGSVLLRNARSFLLALLVIAGCAAFAKAQGFDFPSPDNRKEPKKLLHLIEDARKSLKDENVDVIRGQVGTRRVKVSRRKYTTVPVMGVVAREMAISIVDRNEKTH